LEQKKQALVLLDQLEGLVFLYHSKIGRDCKAGQGEWLQGYLDYSRKLSLYLPLNCIDPCPRFKESSDPLVFAKSCFQDPRTEATK
jgi:hypothetical protein